MIKFKLQKIFYIIEKYDIKINNSLVEEIDYDNNSSIDVTNKRETSDNFLIEKTKFIPTAEISLSAGTNISENLCASIGMGYQLGSARMGSKEVSYETIMPSNWKLLTVYLSGPRIFGGISTEF
ncbi:MAG: hypothetical protein ACOC5R_03255 [Elusimicrobiota bacterium]